MRLEDKLVSPSNFSPACCALLSDSHSAMFLPAHLCRTLRFCGRRRQRIHSLIRGIAYSKVDIRRIMLPTEQPW